jgi:hypothetical protein
MQPLLSQLETTLRELLVEQQRMATQIESHMRAIRTADVDQIQRAVREQDAMRTRIAQVEARRRSLTHQLARAARRTQAPNLQQLAEMFPERKLILLQLRQELRDIATRIRERSSLAAKIAGSVLSHLNATVRLIATAASGPSVYTRSGDASMPSRVGVLSVVG